MEKYLEATGKTIDAAIQSALDQLGMDRDQVSVEVLEKPKTGFLGLGSTAARVRISFSMSRPDRVETFLKGLLLRMHATAIPHISETPEGHINIDLMGSDLGPLIGHRGDTLDAIQHLTNYVANRGEDAPVRVTVDAENYRLKRVDSLRRLAQKMASKVLKYKKNLSLEPMNSYERHVIHAALQDVAGVTTHSTGTEPNRRVVIGYDGPRPAGRPAPGAPARPTGDRPYKPGGPRPNASGYSGPRQSRYEGSPRPGGRTPGGRPSGGGYTRSRPDGSFGSAPGSAKEPGSPPAAPGSFTPPAHPRPYDRITPGGGE